MAAIKQKRCIVCRYRKPRRGTKCETCKSREYRAANPIKYAYKTLRDNCTRRKKDAIARGMPKRQANRHYAFTLTLEQFTEFCYKTDYIRGKGKNADSYSIDRYDNDLGYTLDNIRPLTLGDNCKKGTKKLHYDWQTGHATVTTLNQADTPAANPF